MEPDLEMARAMRDAVGALRRYRLVAGRQVFGVGLTEMLALGELHIRGGATPTELAEYLHITSASVTELVDRLERAGLVVRRRHDSDGRKTVVTLTPAAAGRVSALNDRFAAALRPPAGSLSEAERATVLRFLDAATAAVTDIDVTTLGAWPR